LADLNPDARLTASQAALYVGVTVAAVCNWVTAGRLKPLTDKHGAVVRDSRRRPLYRLLDVAKVEREMGLSRQCHRPQRVA
jgi:hypothetical protein